VFQGFSARGKVVETVLHVSDGFEAQLVEATVDHVDVAALFEQTKDRNPPPPQQFFPATNFGAITKSLCVSDL
jgi:hypothetical protein